MIIVYKTVASSAIIIGLAKGLQCGPSMFPALCSENSSHRSMNSMLSNSETPIAVLGDFITRKREKCSTV
jgi:hypothetical protein